MAELLFSELFGGRQGFLGLLPGKTQPPAAGSVDQKQDKRDQAAQYKKPREQNQCGDQFLHKVDLKRDKPG